MSHAERARRRREHGLPGLTDAQRRYYRRRTIQRHRINAAFIARYKLGRGCADCGYRAHHVALDLDHLPHYPKRGNVSRLLGRTHGVLLEELSKCEVVCSNCHRIRTYERRLTNEATAGAAHDTATHVVEANDVLPECTIYTDEPGEALLVTGPSTQSQPTMMSRRLGARVRRIRQSRGYSLRTLTDAMGAHSKSALSDIERGLKGCGVDYFARLADALGVSMDTLYWGENR